MKLAIKILSASIAFIWFAYILIINATYGEEWIVYLFMSLLMLMSLVLIALFIIESSETSNKNKLSHKALENALEKGIITEEEYKTKIKKDLGL